MKALEYFVVLRDGRWTISFNQHHFGPYATRQAAILRAVEDAHSEGERGAAAVVYVQQANARFRTEWRYGLDVYPYFPLPSRAA
jgi:hypothetical protein